MTELGERESLPSSLPSFDALLWLLTLVPPELTEKVKSI